MEQIQDDIEQLITLPENGSDPIYLQTCQTAEQLVLSHESRIIVFACDQAYAMPLATSLRSLLENSSRTTDLEIVIITSEFSEYNRLKLLRSLPRTLPRIHWLQMSVAPFEHLSTRQYISKITFARLLIPELLPIEVSRVLYLDADILIANDLTALWEYDLGNAILGAVTDSEASANHRRLQRGVSADYQGMVEPGAASPTYFNAGVLLINLKRWREEQVSQRALRFIAEYPDTALADQDALNVVCAGQWAVLGDRWNCQHHDPRGYLKTPTDRRPAIIHYAGKWKPWNPASLNPDAKFYDDFRSRTQFARTRAEIVFEGMYRTSKQVTRFAKQYGRKLLLS